MQLIKFTPKLRVIVLFIVLFSGISLVPTLQIAVQGQVQQQRSPPTPGTIAHHHQSLQHHLLHKVWVQQADQVVKQKEEQEQLIKVVW